MVSPDGMSKDCGPTTVRRTRTNRFEDGNERCKASNRPNLLSASCLFMRRSTTHSMFNGIWSAVRRIDGFEPPRINVGVGDSCGGLNKDTGADAARRSRVKLSMPAPHHWKPFTRRDYLWADENAGEKAIEFLGFGMHFSVQDTKDATTVTSTKRSCISSPTVSK